MLLHKGEKFHRGHLKRNGDVLIGVHQNYVVDLVRRTRLKIGTTVVFGDLHLLRHGEIFSRKINNLPVDLHAFYVTARKIAKAEPAVGAGAAAEDQNRQGVPSVSRPAEATAGAARA